MTPPKIRVVFDVNVFVDAFSGPDSDFPLITEVPPITSNSAMDAFSLAWDGFNFGLYVSPHILQNASRVLKSLGLSSQLVAELTEVFVEVVNFSGGSVLEPDRLVFDVRDFEDNLILDVAKAVDAQIVVTSDKDLLEQSPWNGRLIMRPRKFVEYLVSLKARI